MGTKYKLTVLTPTYNRRERLPDLLESLAQQTNKNFQWLVIDDGSQDKTQEWFSEILKKDWGFPINYYVKENGGKHTALNFSHQYIQGDYVVVVDSDDILTEDSVETIVSTWENKSESNTKLIVFQRGYRNAQKNAFDDFTSEEIVEGKLSDLVNRGMSGDHCETVKAEDFKKYKFPVFPGEKFMGEAWLWQQIADSGETLVVNKIIYLCEYLEGGLSKSGRALRIKNPLGGMEHARIFLDKRFKMKIRIKQAVLYSCYSLFAKENLVELLENSGENRIVVLLSYPFGLVLYLYWKKKYCK